MFNRCDFLLGEGQSVVIVVPAHLPYAETYTVAVTEDTIKFRAGFDDIAEMHYPGGEIYKRISGTTQVGLVEYPPEGELPDFITNVAYVEVRRKM
ncbi:MAG: hypothetical protein H6868_10150 [Rhodospirillales bacterium]|nr:hypothetical protein [Rhodospirillales bacterium]